MATLSVGISSPAVKMVQEKLNDAFNQSVVAVSGSYDEKTAAAVARFQGEAKIAQTGSVDDRTMAALFWAAKPKRAITYNGKTYYVCEGEEYNAVSSRLIKKAEAQTRWYVNMARNVKGLWDEQKKVRDGSKFFAFIVEEASDAKFPDAGVINAAVSAADAIAKAAGGKDYNAYNSAVNAGSEKIRQSNAAMNQYFEELFAGGAKLVEELEEIKEGCVTTLEISAAVATGGSSVAVTAAVMGGLGSYKALLSEIDKASVKPDTSVKDAVGHIIIAGVIDATVGAIMKGKGDDFAKACAESVGSVALKKVGSEALAGFIERAIEGGGKAAAESALKDMAKAFDPNQKITVEEALKNAAKNFVRGALLQQLDGVLTNFCKNAPSIFSPKDFDGLGKVSMNKAMKDGGSKVIEISYNKNAPAALKAADGDPKQVQSELKDRIVDDAAVQKWFTEYAKKQDKK